MLSLLLVSFPLNYPAASFSTAHFPFFLSPHALRQTLPDPYYDSTRQQNDVEQRGRHSANGMTPCQTGGLISWIALASKPIGF